MDQLDWNKQKRNVCLWDAEYAFCNVVIKLHNNIIVVCKSEPLNKLTRKSNRKSKARHKTHHSCELTRCIAMCVDLMAVTKDCISIIFVVRSRPLFCWFVMLIFISFVCFIFFFSFLVAFRRIIFTANGIVQMLTMLTGRWIYGTFSAMSVVCSSTSNGEIVLKTQPEWIDQGNESFVE